MVCRLRGRSKAHRDAGGGGERSPTVTLPRKFRLAVAKDIHEMDMAFRQCELDEKRAALASTR